MENATTPVNEPVDQNKKKKKLAIIAGIVVLGMVILVVLVTIFARPQNTNQNLAAQSPTPFLPADRKIVEPSLTVSTVPSPSISLPVGWVTKGNNDIQFSYPADWFLKTQSLQNGYSFNLSPSFPPSGVVVKQMNLQVFPKPGTTLENTQASFKALGYTQNPIAIGPIRATQYKGSINLPTGKLNETVIVFDDPKNVYRMIETYEAADRNQIVDSEFNSVAQTIRLPSSSPNAQ